MVELMHPYWCSAGWGINTDIQEGIAASPRQKPMQRLYPLLQRFPGLNVIHHRCLKGFIFNQAMHSINWLNYVSDPLLDQLGGREHVRDQIKSSQYLSAKDVGNCLGIAAGNFPWMGDTDHNITLPAFGEAARLLKPIRIKSYEYFLGDFIGNKLIAPPSASSKDERIPTKWDVYQDKQAWILACDAYLNRFDSY
jgi:hypothetical protein